MCCMANSPNVNVRVPAELLARIEAAAAAESLSRSELIKRAVEQYLSGTAAAAAVVESPPKLAAKLASARKVAAGNRPPKPGGHGGYCMRVTNPDAYCRGCAS